MARLKNTDNTGQKQQVQTGRKGSSLAVIVAVCLVAAGIAGTGIYLALTSSTPGSDIQETTARRDVVVTPENVDQILAQMQETNPDEYYTASMNVEWTFADGSSPSGNAYVENAPENSRTVYFDVILVDTSELVYSSPYIPVGSYLEDITLTKDLDAGTYDAICIYHLVDDNENELSTVSVSVTLDILN